MKLWRKMFESSVEPAGFWVPEGQRIYAVGDVHGRADLLSRIADLIDEDLVRSPVAESVTVFLGDYVDRGPDSRGVLERVSRGDFPTPVVPLLGNHETMLLDFLADPETGISWRQNGGLETLHSYGLDVRGLWAGRGFDGLAEDFRQVLPQAHLDLIDAAQLWFTAGDYFFCHAGIRPGAPLEAQKEGDLLWIRDPFLSSKANFGKMVVHGHTPVMEPEVRPNRINIDTGAFVSERLTCVALEADQHWFLSTGPGAGRA